MKKIFKLMSLTLPLFFFFSLLTGATAIASSYSNPYGPTAVDPAPPNTIILKLSKGSKSINFSLAQLKTMKSSTLTIYEPFVKKKQSFSVVLLSDLFMMVGIVGNDKVTTLALNDYIYADTAKKFVSASAYLAIARDGRNIPYDQGGPIRIIYPNKSEWAKYFDSWNWSLKEITVN